MYEMFMEIAGYDFSMKIDEHVWDMYESFAYA